MRFHILLLLLSGAAITATASAQTESFDTVWGPISPGGSAATVSLPTFDTTLGTLTSASLALTSGVTGEVEVVNELFSSDSSVPFTNASATFSVGVAGPGGTSTSALPYVEVASGSAPGPAFTITSYTGLTGPNATGAAPIAPSNLSLYETTGPGSVLASVSESGEGTYSITGDNVGVSGTANASGDVRITYNYEAIPEPAEVAAVLGAAAVGLAAFRRNGLWAPA